jgi:hypothetical protein
MSRPSLKPPVRPKGVLDGQAEREEHGARPIVHAHRVVSLIDQRAENDLRHFVAARRELIGDQVLSWHARLALVRRLFGVIERARHERQIRDPSPVEPLVGKSGGVIARSASGARSRGRGARGGGH